MFTLSPVANGGDPSNSKILQVKEIAEDLESILRCIDPNKSKPDANPARIGKLLEAARFYQINAIIHWFRDIALNSDQSGTLVQRQPLLVLGISFQLGLEDCVQRAMHELIQCDVKHWDADIDVDIPFQVIQYCRSLRDKRFRLYNELIVKLADFEVSNSGRYKDKDMSICMTCSVVRAEWIHNMILTAVDHPKWTAFKEVYEDVEECTSCEILWKDYKSKPYEKWCNRVRPESFETKLPLVPSWMKEHLSRNAVLVPGL